MILKGNQTETCRGFFVRLFSTGFKVVVSKSVEGNQSRILVV